MSDNLGPLQPRVLSTDFRNFEAVVYQKRKPPLSSEVNLSNKIDTEQTRQSVHNLFPSGWAFVGDMKENVSEDACAIGDILTSSTLPRNTIKLIAKNKGELGNNNVAWVNGWPILVQGVYSLDDNNLILPEGSLMEPPASDYNVNFVFLEVWRKLITPTDTIYKYGNVQYIGTDGPTNDLIDCTVNYETSLRIQIQYRVRVVSAIDIENNPDGFDPSKVFSQGPRATAIGVDSPFCSVCTFTKVPGDQGLWRSGDGDVTAEALGTVDGYTYAIPMFAIARRNKSAYHPIDRTNGAGHTLADYLGNIASDRPDGLYSDWIVADDILDMRHKVGVDQDLSTTAKEAFNKLIVGKLRTKMTKMVVGGQDYYGVVPTQMETITGDGVRRNFSNASNTQIETLFTKTVNDKYTGTQGAPWALTESIRIDLATLTAVPGVTLAPGTVQIFSYKYGPVGGISTSLTSTTITVTINNIACNIFGTLEPIHVKLRLSYPAGPYGVDMVPEKFLEFRKDATSVSIATRDNDIILRDSSAVGTVDGTFFHTLQNRGGLSTEVYDFGHQMLYHAKGTASGTVSFKRDISGYSIIGIANATIDGSTALTLNSLFRSSTDYTATFVEATPLNRNIELHLYTATKFFDTNKQGRAVVDTFEMAEIVADQLGDNSRHEFSFDTSNRSVLALATYNNSTGSVFNSGYAFSGNSIKRLSSFNKGDSTRSSIVFGGSAPGVGVEVKIPVLMRSPIPAAETYYSFYKTVPYQGLLDSTVSGVILAEGPAITTTAGSGAITNQSYNVGTIQGISGTGVDVYAGSSGVQWASNVRSGQVLIVDDKEFVIDQVNSDTHLTLKNAGSWSGGPYSIQTKDQPYFNQRNIVDRLPILNSNMDSSSLSGIIGTGVSDTFPVLETRILNRTQDITKDATIGVYTADRGRSTVHMPENQAPQGLGNLGLRFERLSVPGAGYKKTYQSYVLNHEGKPCLMVVGSETDPTSATRKFNENSNDDVVDIFELPGRPLVK